MSNLWKRLISLCFYCKDQHITILKFIRKIILPVLLPKKTQVVSLSCLFFFCFVFVFVFVCLFVLFVLWWCICQACSQVKSICWTIKLDIDQLKWSGCSEAERITATQGFSWGTGGPPCGENFAHPPHNPPPSLFFDQSLSPPNWVLSPKISEIFPHFSLNFNYFLTQTASESSILCFKHQNLL